MEYRVLIVDDQARLLSGLRALLSSSEWSVCGEAMDGVEAVEKAKSLRPDLIIMDISMPRMDGVDARRRHLSSRGRRHKTLGQGSVLAIYAPADIAEFLGLNVERRREFPPESF